MVFQRGFEPPTPALGGRCSIQLSYWNKTSPCGYGSTRAVSTEFPQSEARGQRPCAAWAVGTKFRTKFNTICSPQPQRGLRYSVLKHGSSKRRTALSYHLAINTLSKKLAASLLVLIILENVDAFFKSLLAWRGTLYSSSS